MGTRVLVCYATAAASTAGIAARIAEVIGATGCAVSCQPAGPDLDLSGVDALVLGSAVHDMAWLPAALEVMARIPRDGLPVWCFSVGAVEPKGPLTRLLARLEAERVQAGFPAGLTPRDHRVFRGVVVLDGVPWWGRLFYRVVSGPDGDHRNWHRVEGWAAGIAAGLAADELS
jgi:menaquinone-dependent protoporphyrinogen oxidase